MMFLHSKLTKPFLSLSALFTAMSMANAQSNTLVETAKQRMETAAGAPVQITTSTTTGLATFVATTRQKPIPTSFAASVSAVERGKKFLDLYGAAFDITSSNQIQLQRPTRPDQLGMEHVRFQQVKNGVPVRGGEIILHLRGANATAITAKTLPDSDLAKVATTPTLTAAQAITTAKKLLAKQLNITDATLSTPKLEIFNQGLFENYRSSTHLAWFIEATKFGLREQIWIDAERGAILLHFNQVANALNREVYTADDTDELPGELIRSEGEPATGDADADAAYDYAGDTYNYFFNQHGRDSYDDKGAKIISTVHYCEEELICPYENAFWDGIQMVYGEGFSLADDVVAHELTHAVTEKSAALAYYMQSGALNESYSDIFGETVDLTNNKGTDTAAVRWYEAEDVDDGPVRNMLDPHEFYQPAKVSDSDLFACTYSAVHTNSGVPNHAYALMVDGGTYNGQTITGIGLTKAGKIQYRSLIAYLTATADFQANYTAVQQACTDLIGTAGITANDCAQVKKALDAVEMNLNICSPPEAPALCPVGQVLTNLFFDDLENITSGKWATADISGDDVNHWNEGDGTPDIYWMGVPTSGWYHFWGYNYAWIGDSVVNMTSNVTLSAGARMQFNHLFNFACGYGGGVIEYSIDNGTSWIDAGNLITDGHKYKYTLTEDYDNPLGGRKAFTCNSLGYAASQLNLNSLAGKDIRFRFRVGTADGVSALGWVIDDIRLYTCAVAPVGKLSIADVTKVEGSIGTTAFTFTVTLSAASTNTVVVDYATANGTAGAGTDFSATSGTLIFAPGQTSKTVTVNVIADTAFEANETFIVNLTAPSGATIADGQAIGTIQDDDSGFKINDLVKTEGNSGNTAFGFTVTLAPAKAVPVTVKYATADDTAIAGSDFVAVAATTLTFVAGETSKVVVVNVKGDTVTEPDETFKVNLTAASGAPITDNQGIGTILNDDNLLRITDVTKAEGNNGNTSVAFTISLVPASTTPVTVTYATADNTATAGSDYVAIPATNVTFASGETSKTVTVNITGDTNVEANEVFFLNLSNAVGATIVDPDARGQGTIFNDDGSLLRITNVNKGEGNSGVTPLNFNISLAPASTNPVTVKYVTANGTADGSDFTALPATTVTFATGQTSKTVTVNVKGDAIKEPNEIFYLNLSNAVGATIFDTDSRAIGTILNDEGPLLRITDAVTVEDSDEPLTFTVSLSPVSATQVTVAYATANGTAIAGRDYTALATATLTFAANQTSKVVSVNALGDTELEANENLYLNLSNATGATIFDADSHGTGVIVDDEELAIR